MKKTTLLFILSFISLNAYDLVAHRGYYAYPENSKESVKYALKHNYDGVEIDIQPLKGKKDFALIHDAILKREVASSFDKKNVTYLTKDRWLKLYKKQNGVTTNYHTTTLEEVLQVFQKNKTSKKQFLNIELKSPLIEIDTFYKKIHPYLKKYKIQVSSNYLFLLERLRKKDSSLYLGYIFLPNATNIKEKTDKKVKSFLNKYHLSKMQNFYENHAKKAKENYETKISKEYFSNLTTIESKIGSNMGIHIDFKDIKKYLAQLKDALHSHNFQLYIYSIDEKERVQKILNYLRKNNIHFNGVITNEEKK